MAFFFIGENGAKGSGSCVEQEDGKISTGVSAGMDRRYIQTYGTCYRKHQNQTC